jgi:hypothetical protein
MSERAGKDDANPANVKQFSYQEAFKDSFFENARRQNNLLPGETEKKNFTSDSNCRRSRIFPKNFLG